MPQLQCPSCQKTFRVKDEWAGKRVKCPCGNQIVVPGASAEDVVSEQAVPSTAASNPPREQLSPSLFSQPNFANNSDLMGAGAPAAPINPYAPTASTFPLGQAGSDDEAIRKAHLSHESSIKSIGVLYLLGSIIGFLLAVVYLVAGLGFFVMPNKNPTESMLSGVILLVLALFMGSLSTFQFILARGLRRLTPWCRIGGIVLSCIGLIGFPIGTLISAYFLYLFCSQKGAYVFSPEYARVIAATPHIKYKTSIIVWILLGILLFVIGLAIIGAVIGTVMR